MQRSYVDGKYDIAGNRQHVRLKNRVAEVAECEGEIIRRRLEWDPNKNSKLSRSG